MDWALWADEMSILATTAATSPRSSLSFLEGPTIFVNPPLPTGSEGLGGGVALQWRQAWSCPKHIPSEFRQFMWTTYSCCIPATSLRLRRTRPRSSSGPGICPPFQKKTLSYNHARFLASRILFERALRLWAGAGVREQNPKVDHAPQWRHALDPVADPPPRPTQPPHAMLRRRSPLEKPPPE
jgi:hypothetical protein|eukprot:CAMPEP_0198679060 /NCGR_PEP_ID=MMETSP1468-20131203/2032_1 /TAXON_ID=1461545 /ORGANISM="Mantoniella sp, Strain CCMP1436" /LENGTH=182 /DNA_ID=CAMNT_0044417263 /DNA_START=120 /DNA_END=668 /DNA_ORIENTATION=+